MMLWLGGLISLLCGVWFLHVVGMHLHGLAAIGSNPHTWPWLALAMLLYLVTYPVVVNAWRLAFLALGTKVDYVRLLQAQMLSQIAKYLPGNVGQYLGRAWLAKQIGPALDVVMASMLLDLVAQLAGILVCAIPAINLLVHLLNKHGASLAFSVSLIVILVLALLGALLAWPSARRRLRDLAVIFSRLSLRRAAIPMLAAVAQHVLSFALAGIALTLLLHTAGGDTHILPTLGVFSVAWLLGFLMPVAPAGLGIRDLTLVLGLSPIYGEHIAIAGALALRLIWTLGDGLAFVLGLLLHRVLSMAQSPS